MDRVERRRTRFNQLRKAGFDAAEASKYKDYKQVIVDKLCVVKTKQKTRTEDEINSILNIRNEK